MAELSLRLVLASRQIDDISCERLDSHTPTYEQHERERWSYTISFTALM